MVKCSLAHSFLICTCTRIQQDKGKKKRNHKSESVMGGRKQRQKGSENFLYSLFSRDKPKLDLDYNVVCESCANVSPRGAHRLWVGGSRKGKYKEVHEPRKKQFRWLFGGLFYWLGNSVAGNFNFINFKNKIFDLFGKYLVVRKVSKHVRISHNLSNPNVCRGRFYWKVGNQKLED